MHSLLVGLEGQQESGRARDRQGVVGILLQLRRERKLEAGHVEHIEAAARNAQLGVDVVYHGNLFLEGRLGTPSAVRRRGEREAERKPVTMRVYGGTPAVRARLFLFF